jgi:hypothetical protein
MTDTFLKNQFTFLSLSFLEREILRENCIEKPITHFKFSIFFFEIGIVYEIKWKNFVEQDTDENILHTH